MLVLLSARMLRITGLLMVLSVVLVAADETYTSRDGQFYKAFEQGIRNVIFSPFSLCSSLYQIAGYARGQTVSEIVQILGVNAAQLSDVIELNEAISSEIVLTALNSFVTYLDPSFIVAGGNDLLFLNSLSELLPRREVPGVLLEDGPFTPDRINRYLRLRTDGKIAVDVSPDWLTRNTLLLINTMVVKAPWFEQYDRQRTYHHQFLSLTEHGYQKKEVEMMIGSRSLFWKRDHKLRVDVVAVPLRVDELYFVIVLPHDKEGLHDVETAITQDSTTFESLFHDWQPDILCLDIPKFTINTTLYMKEGLQSLGMVSAFNSSNANFCGLPYISQLRDDIYLSNFVHAAAIQVTEEGISLSEDEEVLDMDMPLETNPPENNIVADHPFIFLIREQGVGKTLLSVVLRKMREVIAAMLIFVLGMNAVGASSRQAVLQKLSAESEYFFRNLSRHFNQTIYSTVMSPHSIHSALLQTAAIVGGPSADEIILALGMKFSPLRDINAFYNELHNLFRYLNSGYEVKVFDPVMLVACGNMILQLRDLNMPFIKRSPLFGTTRCPCINPEAIRSYIQSATDDNIDIDVPPNLLAPTNMLLLSTMVVSAEWQHQFPRANTYKGVFESLRNNVHRDVKVHMMTDVRSVRWKRDEVLKVDVVEIPLRGRKLGFYIVLPHAKGGLLDFEKRLLISGRTFANLASGLAITDVHLAIPRFSVHRNLKLKKVLQAMGVVTAFSAETAEFKLYSFWDNLYISEVMQATSIMVNEEGISQSASRPRVKPENVHISATESFIADHPFSFFIRHNSLGRVLISGRYTGSNGGE